jgi:predicted DNA-binding transcriptional regulator AlpA
MVNRKDAMAHLDADLLKPSDIALRLGVSRSWVYDAANSGRSPCVRLGAPDGPLRFLPDDIERWLARARRGWVPGESAKRAAERASATPAATSPQLPLAGLAGDPS